VTLEPRAKLAVALTIAAFTLTGFLVFPGHTWLGSDTQIYIPLLERLRDPSLFSRELIALHPHLSWTIYDEVALALRRLTSLTLQQVLTAEQLAFRALALWGVYLIAASLGLSRRFALMVSGLYGLGATVPGPALLTIEYEPVPRGFALALILLAIGLTLRGRRRSAAVAGSLAILFQAPVTVPFWLVYTWLAWRKRQWRLLIAPAVAAALLVLLWRLQSGGPQSQPVFGRIGAAWEEVLRFRASYVWVSDWPRRLLWQYGLLWLVSLGAVKRLWERLDENQRAFWLGIPLTGLMSLPISYLLLDRARWSLIPQFQPARYVLFVTVCAVLLSAIAGIRAAQGRNRMEAFGWMLVVFAVPVHGDLLTPFAWKEVLLIALLAAAAVAAVRAEESQRWVAAVPCLAVVLLAVVAIPNLGGAPNYPDLDSPALDELSAWGATTPQDALFHFPDAGHGLYPGIFRARARRAVYVDWKGGGQANFFEDLALEWRERWRSAMTTRPNPARFRALGIDYLVVSPRHRLPKLSPVFENKDFVAYRLPL